MYAFPSLTHPYIPIPSPTHTYTFPSPNHKYTFISPTNPMDCDGLEGGGASDMEQCHSNDLNDFVILEIKYIISFNEDLDLIKR